MMEIKTYMDRIYCPYCHKRLPIVIHEGYRIGTISAYCSRCKRSVVIDNNVNHAIA
jgi:uncharacterized protein YbaR (Trm112 family)